MQWLQLLSTFPGGFLLGAVGRSFLLGLLAATGGATHDPWWDGTISARCDGGSCDVVGLLDEEFNYWIRLFQL